MSILKHKIIIIFSLVFIAFMTGLLIFYLIKGDSSRWMVALGGILVSALPISLLFVKNNPFNIPIIIGYYVFIFCTTFLGSIANFYGDFKWWDSGVHFYKGIFVGFVGIVLYKLFIPQKARKDVSRWVIFLFVLSLSVIATVLWEIYEFAGDLTFTHTMQRGGNKDTMYDIIFGLTGGLLISIYSCVQKLKL
ncbi:membrane-spanning protein [Bacillus sp. ISL-4]|uniref:membrane-spanning protein n=1 Tax=Bacillus sp. ISL-4 TaxID=2819125 RepID=UPI002867BD28|nr:membrane-spanning protein [Bacillus sp. ISL-4]